MKSFMKVIVLTLVAITANAAVADHAWFSENIQAIIVAMEKSGLNLNISVDLYGTFSEKIWRPPAAKFNSTTGDFTDIAATKVTVTKLARLNEMGKYDPAASLSDFQVNCGSTVTDEFDQPYTIYDSAMKEFYQEYEDANYNSARQAFDSLENYFTTWKDSYVNGSVVVTDKAKELAEKADEIYDRFQKAQEELNDAAKNLERVTKNFNSTLVETKAKLNKIAGESVVNAQNKINDSVADFNSFIDKLTIAVEAEDWNDSLFENSMGELERSEKALVDAIAELQKSSGNPEALQAIYALQLQLNQIRELKFNLRTAINNKDKNAARSVLAQARNTSFADSRKKVSAVNNLRKELESKKDMLETIVSASVSAMNHQIELSESIKKLGGLFSTIFVSQMDNFHRIGAYLCSTNSMEYLDKRMCIDGNASLADFTVDELARWIGITMQEPLFRDANDKAYYETIGKLGTGSGYTYDNYLRFLSSTYFVTYYDVDALGRFMSTYGEGMFNKNKIRGFYAEEEGEEPENIVTNWYAKNITAPVNWADGTSIVVTNGKFKAIASGYALKVVGTTASNYKFIGAPASKTNTVTFASASDSNVAVTIGGQDDEVIVTIGVYYK